MTEKQSIYTIPVSPIQRKVSVVTEDSIEEKTVNELVRSVKQNKGHYAFLIGAGTSRAAGIPTAKELIAGWKKERYEIEHGDSEDKPEFDDWVNGKESDVDNNQKYGFWFKQCHTTEAERRKFIRQRVEGKEPTFGIIVLAAMMSEGIFPVTLTPNFDDLLYDAFYFFLEEKPLVIDHDSLAPQFRINDEVPTIIKLHGDYLYDNLQNTTDETNHLRQNMEEALEKTLNEHGLIVLGYGGKDRSIMKALKSAGISEYGLWWCKYEGKECLSDRAKELLRGSNRYTVEVSGAKSLFTTLWYQFQEELQTTMPDSADLINRAKKRGRQLRKKYNQQILHSTGKEKQALQEVILKDQAFVKGRKAISEEKYKKAIDILNKAIDKDPEYVPALTYRAIAYDKIEEYGRALQDLDKAIQLDQSIVGNFFNRGSINAKLGNLEKAIVDYTKALEIDENDIQALQNRSDLFIRSGEPRKALDDAKNAFSLSETLDEQAISLMLKIISKTIINNVTVGSEDARYRKICSKEFSTIWEFGPLYSWLEEADIDNKDYIREIIGLLKEHKE